MGSSLCSPQNVADAGVDVKGAKEAPAETVVESPDFPPAVVEPAPPKSTPAEPTPPPLPPSPPSASTGTAVIMGVLITAKEQPDSSNTGIADSNSKDEAEDAKVGFQEQRYSDEAKKLDTPMEVVVGKMARRKSSCDISFDAYVALHLAEFERVLELEKPDGWTWKKEDQGVSMYIMSAKDTPFLYFKGVSDFTCKTGIIGVVSSILKTEDRPQWDETCAFAETPQFYPPFYKYGYFQLKAKGAGIIAPRDAVTLGRIRFEQDGAVVISIKSAEHPDYPEKPGIVRINFIEGGYVVRPSKENPDLITVSWFGCVDPKGWLPTWLVNMIVTKQCETLAKVKTYMAKKGL